MTARDRKAERRAKAHAKFKGRPRVPGLVVDVDGSMPAPYATPPSGQPLPDPVMAGGTQDAKAVFEKLTQGNVDDVGPLEFPTKDQIIAELRYLFDNISGWAAVVTKDGDHEGGPVFRLWYQQGARFQKSGIFTNGQDLINFLRKEALFKFEGVQPNLDTLDSLRHKSASSVVPVCFKAAKPHEKCGGCPYVETCFEGPTLQDAKYLREARAAFGSVEEPEEVFLHRLQGKIKNADWED